MKAVVDYTGKKFGRAIAVKKEQHRVALLLADEFAALVERACGLCAAHRALIDAMLRHHVPGKIVEHPEVNAAFGALIRTGPVRMSEIDR